MVCGWHTRSDVSVGGVSSYSLSAQALCVVHSRFWRAPAFPDSYSPTAHSVCAVHERSEVCVASFDMYWRTSHVVCEAHPRSDVELGAVSSYCCLPHCVVARQLCCPALGCQCVESAHCTHATAPGADAWCPAAHGLQIFVPAGENWPFEQAEQVPSARPPWHAERTCPGGHVELHVRHATDPPTELNLPSAQFVHVVAPAVLWKRPVPQAVQPPVPPRDL